MVEKCCRFDSSKWCGWDSCTFLYDGRICFCENYGGSHGGFTRKRVLAPHVSLQNKHCHGDFSVLRGSKP